MPAFTCEICGEQTDSICDVCWGCLENCCDCNGDKTEALETGIVWITNTLGDE